MNNKKHFLGNKIRRRDASSRLYAQNRRLQSIVAKLEKLCADVGNQAIRDPLTGVFNRQRLESMLATDTVEPGQGIASVSIVMLDMDNLKDINDTFGHAAGDQALRMLGEKLRQMTRPEDMICRYGGDEFIVLLHNVNLETAYKRAEEWRREVEENPIFHQGTPVRTTVTAGVANYTKHGDTLAKTIEAADKALYWAKNMGRNCIATADDIDQLLYFFPGELLTNKDYANV